MDFRSNNHFLIRKINLQFYANCFFQYPLSLQVFFPHPKHLHYLWFFLCNDLTQGRTWIHKIYAMFSGKVCQYLESKHADPVHAGKEKSTLHFSNACILQSVRSIFLNIFDSHLIVVNLKILWLKMLRWCFNQSCICHILDRLFWSVFDAKLSRKFRD